MNLAKDDAKGDQLLLYNDLCDPLKGRIERFSVDLVKEQEMEVEKIINALNRAIVDQKSPMKVFLALRIDWLDHIGFDPVT